MEENLKIKDLSFENALSELEKISNNLQMGKLNLAEAVEAYELGIKLKKHAESKLRTAQLRLSVVGEEKANEFQGKIHEISNLLCESLCEHYQEGNFEAANGTLDLYKEKVLQLFQGQNDNTSVQ